MFISSSLPESDRNVLKCADKLYLLDCHSGWKVDQLIAYELLHQQDIAFSCDICDGDMNPSLWRFIPRLVECNIHDRLLVLLSCLCHFFAAVVYMFTHGSELRAIKLETDNITILVGPVEMRNASEFEHWQHAKIFSHEVWIQHIYCIQIKRCHFLFMGNLILWTISDCYMGSSDGTSFI